jgi:hypothetical protein
MPHPLSLREKLEALIETWRAKLAAYDGGANVLSCDEAGQMSACLDEVDALLSASPHDGWVDLVTHLQRQRRFSERTFGPGQRTAGVLDHIRKELNEIEREPTDLTEWIDVVLLALDGAWRHGHEPQAIAAALVAKQAKNEARVWPDWRTAPAGKAIEHVKPLPAPPVLPAPESEK